MDPRITFDFHGRCIIRHNQKTSLSLREFQLLSRLVQEQGHSVPIEVLAREALGGKNQLAVRLSIRTLRKKLEGPEGYPEMIRTHRGYGYRLSIENMIILD